MMDKLIFYKMLLGNVVLFILSTAVLVFVALLHPMLACMLLPPVVLGRLWGWLCVPFGKRHFLPEAVKTVVWAVLAGGIFWHYQQKFTEIRQAADKVVAQVRAYHAAHGKYPPREAFVPSPDTPLKVRIRYIPRENGQPPILYYKDPVMVFDNHIYDFQKGVWEYRPD